VASYAHACVHTHRVHEHGGHKSRCKTADSRAKVSCMTSTTADKRTIAYLLPLPSPSFAAAFFFGMFASRSQRCRFWPSQVVDYEKLKLRLSSPPAEDP
jgi:hypothetical protein